MKKISASTALVLSVIWMMPLLMGVIVLSGWDAVKSLGWQKTRGEILSAQSKKGVFNYSKPVIRYTYKGGNKIHVSNNIWVGNFTNLWPLLSKSKTHQLLASYAPGATVELFMDPHATERSALIAGPGMTVKWLLVFSFVLFLQVLAILLWNKRKRRKETHTKEDELNK